MALKWKAVKGAFANVEEVQSHIAAAEVEKVEEWVPPKQGTIYVTIIKGRELKDVAGAMSRMDPYTRLTYAAHTPDEAVRTSRVRKHGGKTPTWRDRFTMPVTKRGQRMQVHVFDKDLIGNDEFIGYCNVDLTPAMKSLEESSE